MIRYDNPCPTCYRKANTSMEKEIVKLKATVERLTDERDQLLRDRSCEHDNQTTKWVGEPATGGPDPITTCDDCGKLLNEEGF